MGAVDETRKVVQDFLAPELRELKARVEALEATTNAQFAALRGEMSARFDAQDKVSAIQHQLVMNALQALTNYNALAERLSRLETQRKPESEAQH
jgi:hypothetical protein